MKNGDKLSACRRGGKLAQCCVSYGSRRGGSDLQPDPSRALGVSSSAMVVRVVGQESVVMSVRLDPQHTLVSSGVCSSGDMYSGGISIGQFMTSALNC